jgi:Flp pilus assembly CpaE family ATPase
LGRQADDGIQNRRLHLQSPGLVLNLSGDHVKITAGFEQPEGTAFSSRLDIERALFTAAGISGIPVSEETL